ncbi:MAG: pseudaminic acid cytidylyltransferase [Bdellovibrionota bacterium]
MANISIIPARGGSKRIPRKNIKSFFDKPIITYSIEAAAESGLFDKIIVSTDDEEIAKLAERYGAEVPFLRSRENSDDFATTVDVLVEVLDRCKQAGFGPYANVCCLYPTAVFVDADILKDSYAKFNNGELDSLIPVVKFSYPVQRAFKLNADSKIDYERPEFKNVRSQDIQPLYHDAGQFYWSKVASILKFGSLVTERSFAYVRSELEVQDLDTIEDWKIAEMKYRVLKEYKIEI